MTLRVEQDVRRAMIRALRSYAVKHEVSVTHEPVENKVNLGTFDFFIAAGGRCAWVETKFTKTKNWSPRMRAGQPGFGLRMLYANVPACVLVGHEDGTWRILKADCVGKDHRKKLLASGDSWDHTLIERILAVKPIP